MFIPQQGDAARALDQGMREDLAASLERIGSMAAAVLPGEGRLGEAAGHIRSHRIEPGVFALYYDLVFALQNRDFAAAADLWNKLMARAAAEPQSRLMRYRPTHLGEDAERFQRLTSIGTPDPAVFCDPQEEDWLRFHETAPAALDLLQRAHPAWAEEVRELGVWTIAAVPELRPDARGFSGGSSIMAWGAILVNVKDWTDRLGVLGVIAHEATHLLLFGLSRSEPLVTNPVGERYQTEARPMPRPMNALYHSTYVSGRTGRMCLEILDRCHGELSEAERLKLAQTAERQRQRFDQGYEVIRRDAQLTPLGRRLIDEARETLADG